MNHRNASAILIGYDIPRAHVNKFFRTEQFHLQPDPAFAYPDNFAGNPLHSAADNEGTLPGIEPDHAVAGLHGLARDSDKAGPFDCSLA